MEHLILFARKPEAGRVKTRLTPPATAVEALALYEAFLVDQIRFVASLGSRDRRTEICWDEAGGPKSILVATQQGSGDLGERMGRALRRARSEGAGCAVIVGADAPSLPARHVEAAFSALKRGADAVIAPAIDGGYVLIGTREPHPALFESIPWGSSAVAELTRRRAAGAGLALAELPPWRDVDRWEDLAALREELAAAPERAPATARVLARILGVPRRPVV